MEGTARRPGNRLTAANANATSHDTDSDSQQATLVRPALWALSGREEAADQSRTDFRIALPAPVATIDLTDDALAFEDEAVWGDEELVGRGRKRLARGIMKGIRPRTALDSSALKRRGAWAVCATLLLITLSGLAFVAFPSSASHPAPHTANAIGQGAVTDDPQAGALALGQKGAAQVISQTSPVSTGTATGAPCDGPVQFPAKIDTWTVPAGCYGLIYTPNPANYASRPGFGYCNWWVRVMDTVHPDITENMTYPHGSVPRVGAAVYFDGGVQGADPAGHWARVEAIAPDGYWMLISEMNFSWRGGGFGKVDYRFAHTGPGVTFIYA